MVVFDDLVFDGFELVGGAEVLECGGDSLFNVDEGDRFETA